MTSDQPWWLTMPPAEVAAAILPQFSNQSFEDEQRAIQRVASWCKSGVRTQRLWRGTGSEQFEDPDCRAVAEAIQVLEHAGLLMRGSRTALAGTRAGGGSYVGLTRLGWHALQTNTARQHIGLGDATPTT
jgi:hypothetical protein